MGRPSTCRRSRSTCIDARSAEPRVSIVMAPSVIVVGGGMAGLATAYELHRQGVAFVLLESRPRAGGVVLSEELDGFVIDAGRIETEADHSHRRGRHNAEQCVITHPGC